MADKSLAEAEWRKFAQGTIPDDGALLKALGALHKARSPSAVLDAAAAIERQVGVLRRNTHGSKNLLSYLDGIESALDNRRKAAGQLEEVGPALLTGRLNRLLCELRRGALLLPVLIAIDDRKAALLMSRRAIQSSQRKLLGHYLAGPTAPKYLAGHCRWDGEAFSFVVPVQPAGLARKLHAALLQQAGLRAGVRVRGPDGRVEEQPAGEAATGAPVQPVNALQAGVEQHLAVARIRLDDDSGGGGDPARLRALLGFATQKAAAGQWLAAQQALDRLDRPVPSAPVVLVRAAQAWQQARRGAQAQLAALRRELRAAVLAHNADEQRSDEYDEDDLAAGLERLDAVPAALDARLLHALQAALQAGIADRHGRFDDLHAVLDDYRACLAASEMLAAIDANPFRGCQVARDLDTASAAIAAALRTASRAAG